MLQKDRNPCELSALSGSSMPSVSGCFPSRIHRQGGIFAVKKLIVALLLFVTICAGMTSASSGDQKYQSLVAALKGDVDQEIVFTQSEALAVINAGAKVMFEDMPKVTVQCTDVILQDSWVSVKTALSVAGLKLNPQITFSAKVVGDDVVLYIKGMRVGFIPVSVTAVLTAIRAIGCPEYLQVYPLSGRVVVRKRGFVRYLDSISIDSKSIRVFVLGQ